MLHSSTVRDAERIGLGARRGARRAKSCNRLP